jgi:hypothetical protein
MAGEHGQDAPELRELVIKLKIAKVPGPNMRLAGIDRPCVIPSWPVG